MTISAEGEVETSDAVQADRNSQSAYIDIEAKPLEGLDVDVAGRFENYSDFGTTVNGKIAARYDFNDMFAIRGAVSSGFRAPSLQQEYVSYTATTFIAGNAVNSIILRASNPIAASRAYFVTRVPDPPGVVVTCRSPRAAGSRCSSRASRASRSAPCSTSSSRAAWPPGSRR